MGHPLGSFVGLLGSVLLVAACTTSDRPTGCDRVAIDPDKELLIVEPRAVGAVEVGDASLTLAIFAGYAEAAPDRGAAIERRILGPWRRRSVGGALAQATSPLRLAAIANRTDLGDLPDALSPAGEARLVFVLTDGSSAEPSSPELPLTVILEYVLAGDRLRWAEDFHALSHHHVIDDDYVAELRPLVARFSGPGARLAQVRINDGALGPSPLYAELADDGTGAIRPRGLRNTPSESLDPALLTAILTSAETDLARGRFLLPSAFRSLTIGREPRWNLPPLAPGIADAFVAETCSGCHAAKHTGRGPDSATGAGFHVAPGAAGRARLSPFLLDEELGRRAERISLLLCTGQP